MDTNIAKQLKLKVDRSSKQTVNLRDKSYRSKTGGKVQAQVTFGDLKYSYHNVQFILLDNLVRDVIIVLKMLRQHKSITLELGGFRDYLVFKLSHSKNLS